MNILLYCPSWPPGKIPNGIITYCDNLNSGLTALGHHVRIISRKSNGELPSNSSLVDYKLNFLEKIFLKITDIIKPGLREYYAGYRSLIKTIDKINVSFPIDIMEMEESFGLHLALSRHFDFPIVMRLHGPFYLTSRFGNVNSKKTGFRINKEKNAFLNAKYVSSPSQFTANKVIGKYNTQWKLLNTIPNPIKECHPSLHWSKDRFLPYTILFVGRFDYLKGGDIVIKAFRKVLDIYPESKLLFAGPDKGISNNENKNYKFNDYIDKIIPGRHSDRIVYYGKLPPDKIMQLRQKANVTIITSRIENFPYSALEAISYSCPTICSDVGGLKEIIQDGSNGFLFRSEDFSDLADKIIKIFDDSVLAAKIGRNALHDSRTKYSQSVITQQTLSFYKNVIDFHKNLSIH